MPIARFMPGFRLVTGDQLNALVDAVNGVVTPTSPPTSVDSGGAAVAGAEIGTASITVTYLVEMFVPFSQTFTGIALLNGAVPAGNVRLGMATAAGAPITAAVTASTLAAGASAYQKIPFTAPWAAVGATRYFVQLQANSASAKFAVHVNGVFRTGTQTAQTYGTFTAFTPPPAFVTLVGPVCSLYV